MDSNLLVEKAFEAVRQFRDRKLSQLHEAAVLAKAQALTDVRQQLVAGIAEQDPAYFVAACLAHLVTWQDDPRLEIEFLDPAKDLFREACSAEMFPWDSSTCTNIVVGQLPIHRDCRAVCIGLDTFRRAVVSVKTLEDYAKKNGLQIPGT